MNPELAVEMKGIAKRFGALAANEDASLSAAKGEIHALVGENGAGKTTLMKILYGLYKPDAGEIRVNGKKVFFSGPSDAMACGIGMVHQHFMLVPVLSVAENMVLGREPAKFAGLAFDSEKAERETAEISAKYGLALEPGAKAGSLSVGEQQRLEILKVLYRGADIIILDEPTAVLTPQETASFFGILKKLREQGKTVILITHKLQEVKAIAARVTVMRRGRTVASVESAQTSEAELARLMVGRPVIFAVEREIRTPQELEKKPSAISLQNVSALSERGTVALDGISLKARAGEILGIAGVEGNGQRELAEVIAAIRQPVSGEILFAGKPVLRGTPAKMRSIGLSLIPEDRHKHGLILDYPLKDNLLLGRQRQKRFSTAFRFNAAAVSAFASGLIERFDVHPREPGLAARRFSGGNQQKAIVARELAENPKVLLACQPTRGVDVGAIEFIHKRIVAARDAGAAVILISAELSEILSLSDTIAVLYKGKIAGIFPAAEAGEEKLGILMAGGKIA